MHRWGSFGSHGQARLAYLCISACPKGWTHAILLCLYNCGRQKTNKSNKSTPPQRLMLSLLSYSPSREPPAHCSRNNQPEPMNNITTLHIFVCNNGLVQEPLKTLQQGQRKALMFSTGNAWKSSWRLLCKTARRHQDGITDLLIFSSTHSSPTQHKIPAVLLLTNVDD